MIVIKRDNWTVKKRRKNNLDDMVFRMGLTYGEVAKTLDTNYIVTSTIVFTLKLGIHEISDINLLLKSLLPDEVKVKIKIDEKR